MIDGIAVLNYATDASVQRVTIHIDIRKEGKKADAQGKAIDFFLYNVIIYFLLHTTGLQSFELGIRCLF